MKTLIAVVAATFLLALPTPSPAHTEVSSTTPKSGAELAQSPPVIEIQFHDSAKLTSVVLVGVDKQERRLEFKPSEKPNTFNVPDPKLAVGRNEIHWKALSKDGHVASGSLVFIVKPAATAK
jgi:methionine-rich copper-binding protein CopC